MTTQTSAPAAPAITVPRTVPGARCTIPSCCALIKSRPLRCPRCNSTLLIYVEVA